MRALHAGLALSALATLWQAAVWLFDPPSYLIPSPMAVAAAFVLRPGFFLEHGLVTLAEILAGLLSGTGLGIATAFGSEQPPAFNIGLGQRFVLADWLTLRFEVRDHIFVTTQDVNGLRRSDTQSFLLFYAGASFFVPPTFEYSYR